MLNDNENLARSLDTLNMCMYEKNTESLFKIQMRSVKKIISLELNRDRFEATVTRKRNLKKIEKGPHIYCYNYC